ncbi:unnamed protein product [Cylicocyclus nassatus]|uniref:Uncharacterized protein n=1 Tax=Cylicocyclus nassatus TaxID=53992 RepID=A0AA36GPT4_CYLNA|nr:unnamed protein product [Cylicocyclus nassatus]
MIGDETGPACIIPLLPKDVLKEQTYTYSGNSYSIALVESKTVGPRTTAYKYSITYTASGVSKEEKDKNNKNIDSNTEKIVPVYYYRWDKRIMPDAFEELLQLARLCEPAKSICMSNRRKEVFSLIYMFYTYIYVLKQPIKLMDAFRIHTAKCNGSILDRSEMLFVMAIIMEWAYQSRAISKDLTKEHTVWGRSYALMRLFAKDKKNIKSIHPDHLSNLGLVTKENFSSMFETVPRFSSRKPSAMKDKYRRAAGKERVPRKADNLSAESQDFTKPHSGRSPTGKTAVEMKASAVQGWTSTISANA